MAFPQFEVLNPATEIDIARTIASAANGLHLTISDSCTTGNDYGIYVQTTASGTRTSGELVGIATDVTFKGTGGYAYGFAAYVAKTGTCSGVFAAGASIYMDDWAGQADSFIGLDIGMNASEECGSRHCFIRCREHTAIKAGSAVMRLEGGNSASYFLIFDNAAGSEDSAVILDSATCDQTADHRIRVYLEHTQTVRYIYLYPI